jgi:6-pyruvoyltetrahydropterin/6-carboxytetrahydropterin synthase
MPRNVAGHQKNLRGSAVFRLRDNKAAPQPIDLFARDQLTRTIQAGLTAGLTYELAVDSFFGASHAIRPGGAVHTHSFRVQALFAAESVDDNGMLCGFRDVMNLLEAEARRYANRFLNEIEPFHLIQPTGENIAAVIYRNLQVGITENMPYGPRLVSVTLWENPTSSVKVGLA